MPNYNATIPSGSTDGKMTKISATATLGTTLHAAVSGTDDMDEIWIWAVNSSGSPVKLTIEWGGVAAPDDLIEFTVPAENGLHLLIPGVRLQNSLVVTAFAGTADVISCAVNVNRVTA